MKVHQTLNKLKQIISESDDEDLGEELKIVEFEPTSYEDVIEIEKKLAIKLPISYVEHITQYGVFHLGDLQLWPVKGLNTGLNELGSEIGVRLKDLGIEKTCEEISKKLGIPKNDIKTFENFIFFGTEDGEEHCAFDLRTMNQNRSESACLKINFHEIEYHATNKTNHKTHYFDLFIFNHVKNVLSKGYNVTF